MFRVYRVQGVGLIGFRVSGSNITRSTGLVKQLGLRRGHEVVT